MKKVILLLLLFAFATASFSQTKETSVKKIYLQAATGISNHSGFFYEAGIQAMLKNNWVTTFSFHGIEKNPKNLPSDYEQGYVYLIFPFMMNFQLQKWTSSVLPLANFLKLEGKYGLLLKQGSPLYLEKQ